MNQIDKSQYFQTAARYLFELRGAPFFLSPTEFTVLNKWITMGIPQRIVLEGIRNAFCSIRDKSFQRKKLFRLTQCEYEVLEAFKQYKDRKTGGDNNLMSKDESIEKLRKEVSLFIDKAPQELLEIERIFLQTQKILNQRNVDEELLEKADAEVERLLLAKGTKTERKNILDVIKIEYKDKKEKEIQEIFRVKWIKYLRNKHKIPYLSTFYY